MRKPEKLYKSIDHARHSILPGCEEGKYPCFKCRCSGFMIDSGGKISKHISCYTCKGKAFVPKQKFLEWYKNEIVGDYNKRLIQHKQKITRAKELIKEMSKKDLKILIEYFCGR